MLPCHIFAAVGRHATHDRAHGAVGDLLGFVHRKIFEDRRLQIDVLLRVGIGLFAAEFPRFWSREFGGTRVHGGKPLHAMEDFFDFRISVILLTAHREYEAVAWINILKTKVIEDVSKLFVGALLTTTNAAHQKRIRAHHPLHDIELMHMLLNDVVTRKP